MPQHAMQVPARGRAGASPEIAGGSPAGSTCPHAAPEVGDYRNFLRPPAAAERFTIAGQDPLDRPADTRRIVKGLARVMWREPRPVWSGPLRAGLQDWENPDLPAGYTYFGQLIAHDLLQSSEIGWSDGGRGTRFRNDRASFLNLDTVYGAGPLVCPQVYALRAPNSPRTFLRVGAIDSKGPGRLRDIGRTFPPPGAGEAIDDAMAEALVADLRNDDNVTLAQLTGVFHLFHNTVLQAIHDSIPAGLGVPSVGLAEKHFDLARALVRQAYHQATRNDWLKRILHPAIYQRYLLQPSFIDADDGRMPLEFSHAALRFGHAMVRPFYKLNSAMPRVDLDMMLWLNSEHMPHRFPLSPDYVIAWRRFFEFDGEAPDSNINYSSRIGPQMQRLGIAAPVDVDSLAESDLWRGVTCGMWSVWGLRKEIEKRQTATTGLTDFLADPALARQKMRAFLDRWSDGTGLTDADIALIADEPPLFFFILFEAAEGPGEGRHLGALGSIVVAEVVFRALANASRVDPRALAAELYGSAADRLSPLCDRIEAIGTVPGIIQFVAREAGYENVQPPFL